MANPNSQFNYVITPNTPRSRQNLSHTFKFTCDMGELIPDLIFETLPGDYARVNSNIFIRFMPLVFPIMHEIDVYQHYYEVPWYLLWRHWSKFAIPQKNEGEGDGQNPVPVPLYIEGTDLVGQVAQLTGKGSLMDYFGFPPMDNTAPQGTASGASDAVSADGKFLLAPFVAYQLIFDSYYRDEHLEPEMDFDEIRDLDGDIMDQDIQTANIIQDLFTLRYRAWEKDVFTSCLPTPQEGPSSGIMLDLAKLIADVTLKDANDVPSTSLGRFVGKVVTDDSDPTNPVYGWNQMLDPSDEVLANSGLSINNSFGDPPVSNVYDNDVENPRSYDPMKSLQATFDMTKPANKNGASFSVEQLRFAYREQLYKEILNVAGSRDTEVVRSQYGVIPDDLTIGRPRYLGGGKQNVVISEVLQQSQSSNDAVLGEFAGHGISIGSANSFKAYFKYWGYCIGIMSIRPRSAYGQGVPRLFTKFDRYDFYQPHLSHLGEQPVLNSEVFWSWKDGKNNVEFGYQPIYHDYRFIPGKLAGDMRDSLSDMHLNRLFSTRPVLNADFIKIQPNDVNHVFAVPGNESYPYLNHIICEVFHSIDMIRPVPKYATPIL